MRGPFRDPSFRFGDLLIDGPKTGPLYSKIEVRHIFDEERVARLFQMPDNWMGSARAGEWQWAAFKQAFNEYRESINHAIQAAGDLKDGDYKGLVLLTGFGFQPVVEELLPRLMKLKEIAPMEMEWVPDAIARDYVQKINVLAREAKQLREDAEKVAGQVLLYFSVPALFVTGPVGKALSITLTLWTVADQALDKFPQWFRDQSEIKFALGSMEVISAERLDMARLNDRTIWATVVIMGLSGVGVFADAWVVAQEIESTAALAFASQWNAESGHAIEALVHMPLADRGKILRAVEAAEEARTAHRALTGAEQAALKLGERLEEEALVAFRAEATAVEIGGEAARLQAARTAVDWGITHGMGAPFVINEAIKLKAARVPDQWMPAGNQLFKIADGAGRVREFHLGKFLGKGAFAHVYELLDASGNPTGEVIKFYRRKPKSGITAKSVVESTAEGAKLLGEDIPQLRIRDVEANARAFVPAHFADREDTGWDAAWGWVIQQKLDVKTMEVIDFEYEHATRVTNGISRTELVVLGTTGGRLSEPYQRAVARLFRKLADKGLVWEDGHLGNIFFTRTEKGIVAGILDQDRIIDLSKPVADDYMNVFLVKLGTSAKREDFFLDSLLGSSSDRIWYRLDEENRIVRFGMPAEILMAKMFEYGRRYIWFNRATMEFEPVLIDPRIIQEEFGNINKWIDIVGKDDPQLFFEMSPR